MSMVWAVVPSPIGDLHVVGSDAGVHAISVDPRRPGAVHRDDRALPEVREQLAGYFAGELTAFDLPLALRGTEFQLAVWRALLDVPYGGTVSYGEIAARLGQPTASRAVGAANGRNPVPVVVPCHRVIGSNGTLTGYGLGLPRKRFLLELEARVSMERAFLPG